MARKAKVPQTSERGSKAGKSKPTSRVTVSAVNAALAERGHEAILARAGGYFLFRGPDANDWLDRTVQLRRVGDLSVAEWVQAFRDLKQKNAEIQRAGRPAKRARR
jgi:hypothetical protein